MVQLKHVSHRQRPWGDWEMVSEESTGAGDLLQQHPTLPGDLPMGPTEGVKNCSEPRPHYPCVLLGLGLASSTLGQSPSHPSSLESVGGSLHGHRVVLGCVPLSGDPAASSTSQHLLPKDKSYESHQTWGMVTKVSFPSMKHGESSIRSSWCRMELRRSIISYLKITR